MARKQTLDAIIKLYQKLGGNVSEIMGTKTNVNFIGKGEPDMLKMDLNPDALGVLPASKVVDELKDSVSYAVGGKLNDIQSQFFQPKRPEALYNIDQDPHEVNDLSKSEDYKEILLQMREKLRERTLEMPDLSFYPEPYLLSLIHI